MDFNITFAPFFFITLLILLFAIVVSFTRATWLSLLVAMGVWILTRFKVKFSVILIVLVSVLAVGIIKQDEILYSLEANKQGSSDELEGHVKSVSNITTDPSNLERINRWKCAGRMVSERPVFGFGPGTYAFEYGRFQDPKNLTIISTNFGDGGNAHSEYLGPLAETGVIGLATVLLLIGIIFYKSITLYIAYDKKENENKTLLLAMILSLVTYFIHGILNNYLDTDKASVPIFAICACIIVLEKRMKDASVAQE
jgi:O-antigen ligase